MNANKKSGKKSATVKQKSRPAKKPANTGSLFQKFTGLTLSEHLKLKKLKKELSGEPVQSGKQISTQQTITFDKMYKVRHRAEFGISVVKKYWGLGIGKALLTSCIECAKTAGYNQLELKVVAENERAVSMYERAGFVECGRNPKGFRSRIAGFQEVISMRLEL